MDLMTSVASLVHTGVSTHASDGDAEFAECVDGLGMRRGTLSQLTDRNNLDDRPRSAAQNNQKSYGKVSTKSSRSINLGHM